MFRAIVDWLRKWVVVAGTVVLSICTLIAFGLSAGGLVSTVSIELLDVTQGLMGYVASFGIIGTVGYIVRLLALVSCYQFRLSRWSDS